jgi:hypothetical protein
MLFAVLALHVSHVQVRFVIDVVMQPTVHEQVLSSAIGFVEVAMMNGEDVAVFQIREPTIVAPEQSLRASDIRNRWPDVRIAFPIFVTLARRVLSKHVQRAIVTNELFRSGGLQRAPPLTTEKHMQLFS